MTSKELKKKIVKKFGTISKFARCANLNRYGLQKLLSSAEYKLDDSKEERLKNVSLICDVTSVETDPKMINDHMRYEMWEKIKEKGGVLKFSRDNDYPADSIFQILNGKRTTITERVKQLLDLLDIEHQWKTQH